jgi:hypothetical protein
MHDIKKTWSRESLVHGALYRSHIILHRPAWILYDGNVVSLSRKYSEYALPAGAVCKRAVDEEDVFHRRHFDASGANQMPLQKSLILKESSESGGFFFTM